VTQTTLTLTEVAKRCGVSLPTVTKWVGGIRVGSRTVRLECEVIGTRCRVTEEQLQKFREDCRAAKFGQPEPVAESNTSRRRRAMAAARAFGLG
jgi:transposase